MGIVPRLNPEDATIDSQSPPIRVVTQSDPDQTAPGFRSTLGAAFRQDNTVGSFLAYDGPSEADKSERDPFFNSWDAIKGTKYEPYWNRFYDVFNPRASDMLKAQIDMEENDRSTLSAAGWGGTFASLGAGLVDPTVLLPGGELVRGARTGFSIGKSALRVGLAAGAAATVAEAGLQATQEVRPASESAFAIGGSALLGGLIGTGAAAMLGRSERRVIARGLEDVTSGKVVDTQPANEAAVRQYFSDAGAAAVDRPSLSDLTVKGAAARVVTKASAWMRLNPIVRILESPSAVSRYIGVNLFDNPIYLRMHDEGRSPGQAAETLVQQYTQGAVAQAMRESRVSFDAMRKRGVQMSYDEFRREVGRSGRRGDTGPQPEISSAAKSWRTHVGDPLKDRAINTSTLGGKTLLPADVQPKTALSYFSRMWNRHKIEANEQGFRGIVRDWVGGQVDEQVGRLTATRDQRLSRLQSRISDLEMPPEERAKSIESLSAELKSLRDGNPNLVQVDNRLTDLRRQARAAQQAGQDTSQPRAQIEDVVKNAGRDYADYVTARNLAARRLRRIRNNVVGSADQIEQLRQKIADAEFANIGRLSRLHRSLTILDERAVREGPEAVAGELSQARTEFAQVLERSAKTRERVVSTHAKLEEQGKAAGAAGDAGKAADIEKQLARGDMFMAEARNERDLSELADRIGDLENADPEEAIRELNALVTKRLEDAAALVEREAMRIQDLARKAERSDPELVKARAKELRQKMTDIQRVYDDRLSMKIGDAGPDRESYVNDIVDNVFHQLTGRVDGQVPRDIVPVARGPLKERTFNIPDELVDGTNGQGADFLEHDAELVWRRYARIMAGEIELTRKFGSADMKDAFTRLRDDYQRMRDEVTTNAELRPQQKGGKIAHLNKRERRDSSDLAAIRDMLRGTYMAKENNTGFARSLAVVNLLNYLRSMGGVVVGSLSDVARPMMVHGLGRWMTQGIAPLVTNLRAVKLSVEEARMSGAVAERILNTRLATWAEVTDPYATRTPFERFLENTARGFSKANGMVYWNDFQKAFSSVMTQTRIIGNAVGYAGIKARERAYLAYLGIDGEMANRIAKQFAAHGQDDGGVKVANTLSWDDAVAVRAYRAAVNQDVNSIIVTKGIGDTPLFAHTPVGRAVLQFQGFALASHQRAFIRSLQEGPAGFIAGLTTTTAIGMFIYWLRSVESDRPVSDNPGHWLAEGVDRGGLLAVLFGLNNTMEKATGVGAYKAMEAMFPGRSQGGKASRYSNREPSALVLGPTGDFLDTFVRVVNAAKARDAKGNYTGLNEGDVNAISRLLPFATLPGVRSAMQYGVLPPVRAWAMENNPK